MLSHSLWVGTITLSSGPSWSRARPHDLDAVVAAVRFVNLAIMFYPTRSRQDHVAYVAVRPDAAPELKN